MPQLILIRSLAAALVLLGAPQTAFTQTPTETTMQLENPTAFFDTRTREWLDAWASLDMNAVAAVYNTSDPQLRVWDPVPVPENATGWAPYAGQVGPWLSTVEEISFELHDDLQVRDLGDAFLTTRTDTMTAKERGGEPYSSTVRRTLIWRQIDGAWRIVHEHTSVTP